MNQHLLPLLWLLELRVKMVKHSHRWSSVRVWKYWWLSFLETFRQPGYIYIKNKEKSREYDLFKETSSKNQNQVHWRAAFTAAGWTLLPLSGLFNLQQCHQPVFAAALNQKWGHENLRLYNAVVWRHREPETDLVPFAFDRWLLVWSLEWKR